jgi:hypothetical protein
MLAGLIWFAMVSRSCNSVPFIHKKRDKYRNQKHTHPLLLLILLILTINKLQTLNTINTELHLTATISATKSINVWNTRKNNNVPSRQPTSHSVTILLILSGDVHLNPGPADNSPSRYNLIENIVERLSPKKTEKLTKVKTKIKENITCDQNLLSELTSISPKEYIGIDTCSSCYKEVKEKQQAVLCDKCEKWIHRRCSDMKMKTYNENKTKKTFNWICNICRKDDKEIHDKIDVNILKSNELPDTFEMAMTTKNEMLLIHLNARSIVNKNDEFLFYCQQLKPDIICVTETWMDGSVPKQSFTPQGYRVIRKDRSDEFKQIYGKNKGGGIAVYYKQDLKVERKEILKDEHEEILWVQVKAKKSFLLGTIYRAEYTEILKEDDKESKFEEHIRKATEMSDSIIVIGDFNADVTKGSTCKNTVNIKNTCKNYGLEQFIKKPTRIDQTSKKATIIDHIWADKDKKIINKCGTIMGLSDHLSVYAKLNLQNTKKPNEIIRYRSYKTYVQSDFRQELNDNLSRSNIQAKIDEKDPNRAMDTFLKVFQETAGKHAPIKESERRHTTTDIPWYTPELKNKINLKNEILRDWYMYRDDEDYKVVKKMKNEINHLKTKLKKQYYKEKFQQCEGDSKKTWRILKEITRTDINKETTEPENMNKEKANKFNKFFATVGTEIQKKLRVMKHRSTFSGLAGFKFVLETEENVEKLIDRIRPDVAVGYDDISARLIKDAKQTITPYITKMINIGYETNTFPDSMKVTNIKALHKKNNIDDISNYRPISILPTLSKIFERAATDQLVTYLEKNNLINRNQHAYRKGHSTQTCLVELTNLLYMNMERRRYSGIASLDLSKAYDSISHSLLLHKLAHLGLGEDCIKWTKSYLNNRRQRTKFKQHLSDEETITSGIPQGSIIGPVLFICFTNDLAEVFGDECHMISYADDTQLIVEARNLNQLKVKIENVIKLAQGWYERNSMKNNIGKTEILVMSKGNKAEELVINVIDEGEPVTIKSKREIKILGIFLDNKLEWTKQVNNVKKNALNTIRNLHRVRNLLPVKEKIKLYNTLATPQFNYADVVWGGCGKENTRRLQTAQNFALRSIMNRKKTDSAKEILTELKFLNLQEKRQVHDAVFINKALLHKQSANITEQYLKYLPTSNTRFAQAGKLTIPKHTTSKFENSPLYRTIKIWNTIPSSIPTDNPRTFKKQYQKHLVHHTHNLP